MHRRVTSQINIILICIVKSKIYIRDEKKIKSEKYHPFERTAQLTEHRSICMHPPHTPCPWTLFVRIEKGIYIHCIQLYIHNTNSKRTKTEHKIFPKVSIAQRTFPPPPPLVKPKPLLRIPPYMVDVAAATTTAQQAKTAPNVNVPHIFIYVCIYVYMYTTI